MRAELPWLVAITATIFGANTVWAALMLTYSARDQAIVVPLALVLACAAPIAWGLFRVRRAAFIAAMIHGVSVLILGVATTFYTEKPSVLVIAPMAQAALATLVLLMPNIRAPFLHARKGFRRFNRFEANLKVSVEVTGADARVVSGETYDVSVGGAYIIADPAGFRGDMRVKVNIELRDGKRLRIPARISNVSPEGFGAKPAGIGVEFTSLARYDRDTLEAFIAGGRHAERVPVCLPVSFERHGEHAKAQTSDVSMSGCYLQTQENICAPGDRIAMTLLLHDDDPLDLVGEVMWMSSLEAQGKPPGLAIHFLDMSRHDRDRLAERLKEAGAD